MKIEGEEEEYKFARGKEKKERKKVRLGRIYDLILISA
jgi:hypothetical protein